mmetsp:Transcript_33710/g.76315  ORF Transcript_33710/g.76315 Transcript_33710/m.76315 type:complete len:215 (+) Transcript_33710:149-793(+)
MRRCATTGRSMPSSSRARSTSTSSQGAPTPQPRRLCAGHLPTARGAAARCLPASATSSCRGSSSARRCSSRPRPRATRRSSFWRTAAGPTTSSGRSSLTRHAAATTSILSTATTVPSTLTTPTTVSRTNSSSRLTRASSWSASRGRTRPPPTGRTRLCCELSSTTVSSGRTHRSRRGRDGHGRTRSLGVSILQRELSARDHGVGEQASDQRVIT